MVCTLIQVIDSSQEGLRWRHVAMSSVAIACMCETPLILCSLSQYRRRHTRAWFG